MAQLGILEGRIPPGARNRGLFGGTLASSRSRRSVGPAFFGEDSSDLTTWIYNAKFPVNQKWAAQESAQIAATGSGLTAEQKAAWNTELAQADAAARAAYAAQSGASQSSEAAALSRNAGAGAGRGRAAEATYNQVKTAALSAGIYLDVAEAIAKSAAQAVAAGLSYDADSAIAHARPGVNASTAPTPNPTTTTPVSVLATQEQLRQYYELPPTATSPDAPSAPVASAAPSAEDVLRHTFSDSATSAPAPVASPAHSLLIPLGALAAAYFFLKG